MRLKKTAKNASYGLIAQSITIIMNFINRTVFINVLGQEYLGVSGLFSNILSILSLSELGLGTAIVYSLYKPLAMKDEKKIKALMNFYSFSYRVIGITIFGLGLILTPFLDVLIKGKPNIQNLNLIYLMYLLNSSLSYYFTYKRSIISADQNEYLNISNNIRFEILKNLLNILVLFTLHSFIVYLLVNILCSFLSNIRISIIANKIYPFLINNKERLPKSEKRKLLKYVMAQMSHKVGGVVVNGTDNLLISSFVGVAYVGYYSNYLMIINVIKTMLNIIFSSSMASVGNLNASEDKEKSKQVYDKMLFINVVLYGVSGLCLFNLLNDFIYMWVGEEYLLNNLTVLLIVINYYMTGIRQTTITFNTTLGLFWNDRFKPWFEAAINLIASIFLLKLVGISGVFLGTLVSTLTTSFWVEPYILYKHRFNLPIGKYFVTCGKYTVVILFAGIISYLVCGLFFMVNPIFWIIKAFITIVLSCSIIGIAFWKVDEFRYFLGMATHFWRKYQKKLV